MNAGSPTRRRERLLCGLILLAVCCWMISAHWEQVDKDWMEIKVAMHEDVLANRSKDPYQYKLWTISHALQWASEATDKPLEGVFYGNTLLSLLVLVLAHHLWLRTWVGPHAALVGGLALGALANTLFLTGLNHPYEFWGVGLFCVLLRGVQRDWPWWKLALLCLATGLVWEKHALVPVLWGLLQLVRKRPFLPSLGKGLVMFAAALAVPLLVRWHLGTDRVFVDGMTTLAKQLWERVAWYQIPYLLPFLAVFVLHFQRVPTWIRLLWLYLPVLIAAYIAQHFILHEVRSFWALVPVFTATLACWLESMMRAPPATAEPSG